VLVNADDPILFTVAGIIIVTKLEHPLNALSPIVVIFDVNFSEVKPEHILNADLPMVVMGKIITL